MMVLKCLKYDWNHFEKDNTLMCKSKSVIKATYNYNKSITVNDVVRALSTSTTELHLHDS